MNDPLRRVDRRIVVEPRCRHAALIPNRDRGYINLVSVLSVSLLLFTASTAAPAPNTAKHVFKAGAATSNITPNLGDAIVGGWAPVPITSAY